MKARCISARRPVCYLLQFELELKVFLPKKGDGFIETSQAEAGEVLDVHAVEFSKTVPRGGLAHEKGLRAGGPSEEVILSRIRLQAKGSPLSRGFSVPCAAVPAADEWYQ